MAKSAKSNSDNVRNNPKHKSATAPAMAPASSAFKNPELVNVDTALTVLSQVNLLAESNSLAADIGGSLAKLIYLQPQPSSESALPRRPLTIHRVDGSVATALSVHVPVLSGTLHFFAFETRNVHQLLRFIRDHWAQHSNPSHRHIRATGGGAFKYLKTFQDEIDVTLSTLDEMQCTVAGLNFLLTSVENEVYIYQPKPAPTNQVSQKLSITVPNLKSHSSFIKTNPNPFPYLLVNIGSGVSIVKVTDHDKYERISGSSLGGGTFWGLARLLLNCQTFDDIISLTNSGDNANVDMLVGDIYGGSYPSLGLDASVIAASFGKATMRNTHAPHAKQHETSSSDSDAKTAGKGAPSTWSRMKHRLQRAVYGSSSLWLSFLSSLPIFHALLKLFGVHDHKLEDDIRNNNHDTSSSSPNSPSSSSSSPNSPKLISTANGDHQFKPEDVALSLLRMVSYNIGQIAYLNARVHGLDTIYFGGNFIRNHPYTIADISFAVDFWSAGSMKALFLRHDGYLGAIGAFIGASSAAPTKIIEQNKHDVMKAEQKKAEMKRESITEPDAEHNSGDATKEKCTTPNGKSAHAVESAADRGLDGNAASGNETVEGDDEKGDTNGVEPVVNGHADTAVEGESSQPDSAQQEQEEQQRDEQRQLQQQKQQQEQEELQQQLKQQVQQSQNRHSKSSKRRRRTARIKSNLGTVDDDVRHGDVSPNGIGGDVSPGGATPNGDGPDKEGESEWITVPIRRRGKSASARNSVESTDGSDSKPES